MSDVAKPTLRSIDEKVEYITRRFEAHMTEETVVEKATLERIERSLRDNTERTDAMYAVFASAAAGFKILETLGRIAKPALWTLAAVAAFVTFFKTGRFEWPKL